MSGLLLLQYSWQHNSVSTLIYLSNNQIYLVKQYFISLHKEVYFVNMTH